MSAEAYLAIDHHDRHAFVELGAQRLVGVDVHNSWFESVFGKGLLGHVAQVTTRSCIKCYVHAPMIFRRFTEC